MTYYEEKLAIAEAQLDLVVAGFDIIAKGIVSKSKDDLFEALEPYVMAVRELKSLVDYYRKEADIEKIKVEL